MAEDGVGIQGAPPTARRRLLDRVASALVCPDCRLPLGGDGPDPACPRCGKVAKRAGDQFVVAGFGSGELEADWLNRLKEVVKRRMGGIYPLCIRLISPVHLRGFVEPFVRSFDTSRELVADLGSGTTTYGERVVCIDGGRYDNVHLVADLGNLPIADGALDGVISVAVLEHVPDPAAHVREMGRVLRPGGRVLCYIPFIQGFHASPHDYQRYTIAGLRKLFDGFEVIDVRVGAGPTSGLIWILQEWLALALSFGSVRLYRLLVPVMWLLSPLKFLDLLLARHPAAPVIASGHVIEARKLTKESPADDA